MTWLTEEALRKERTRPAWTPAIKSVARLAVGKTFTSSGVSICSAGLLAMPVTWRVISSSVVSSASSSLAICNYIDFNRTGKSFYLFDTFCGIPVEQMLPTERPARVSENGTMYEECYETAKRNFAPYPRAQLIRGRVPDTLNQVPIGKVCYLSLDMNIAAPEVAAIEYFGISW